MKKTNFVSKILSVIICIVLVAAIALTMGACGSTDNQSSAAPTSSTGNESSTPAPASSTQSEVKAAHSFKFIVTDKDGAKTEFDIDTDETTVGAALVEKGLIEGDDSEFGLYVKKVNGILADYNTDGTYWAFYVNGDYASKGVDQTDIEDGATYEFKVEK